MKRNSMKYTCFFIGHRDTPLTLLPKLEDAEERHILQFHAAEFVVGQYGSFDRMAASAVLSAKHKRPEVVLKLLLPYHPAERSVIRTEDFDALLYPPGMETVPRRYAIVKANEYMIRHCDFLICFDCYRAGNTHKLVKTALRRQEKRLIRVENLADCI